MSLQWNCPLCRVFNFDHNSDNNLRKLKKVVCSSCGGEIDEVQAEFKFTIDDYYKNPEGMPGLA